MRNKQQFSGQIPYPSDPSDSSLIQSQEPTLLTRNLIHTHSHTLLHSSALRTHIHTHSHMHMQSHTVSQPLTHTQMFTLSLSLSLTPRLCVLDPGLSYSVFKSQPVHCPSPAAGLKDRWLLQAGQPLRLPSHVTTVSGGWGDPGTPTTRDTRGEISSWGQDRCRQEEQKF